MIVDAYDVIVGIDWLSSLNHDGWPVLVQNSDILEKRETPYIAVLGMKENFSRMF